MPTTIHSRSPRWGALADGLARVAAASVLWTVLLLTVWTLFPLALGYRPLTVDSQSMMPALRPGDVVLVRPVDEVRPGQIVARRDPRSDVIVTHRVVSATDGILLTRGDANPAADSLEVTSDQLVGVARVVIPYAGLPFRWYHHGRWAMLGGFLVLMASCAAISAPHRGRRRRRHSRSLLRHLHSGSAKAALGASLGVVMIVGAPVVDPSDAAFAGASTSGGTFGAADHLRGDYDTEVELDDPVGHWGLEGGTTIALAEDFEGPVTMTGIGHGRLTSAPGFGRYGTTGAKKSAHNDPDGGSIPLDAPVREHWTMSVWVRRPPGWPGGSSDRISLEDANGDGIGMRVARNAVSSLTVEARDGGTPRALTGPHLLYLPTNAWQEYRLTRDGSRITAEVIDANATVLATLTASLPAGSPASFDRLAVRGGHYYFVDDVLVVDNGPVGVLDRINGHDATVSGDPAAVPAPLVAGSGSVSFAFDGDDHLELPLVADLGRAPTRARSVEFWMADAATAGRQVIYDEGDLGSAVTIYVSGGRIHAFAHAWIVGWFDRFHLSAPLPAGTTHVVFTVDTVTGEGALYLDAVRVDHHRTAGPLPPLPAHHEPITVGIGSTTTSYHDDVSGGELHGFRGLLDELAVYDVALSASRIGHHYGAGI